MGVQASVCLCLLEYRLQPAMHSTVFKKQSEGWTPTVGRQKSAGPLSSSQSLTDPIARVSSVQQRPRGLLNLLECECVLSGVGLVIVESLDEFPASVKQE